jgi:hypothetical protein
MDDNDTQCDSVDEEADWAPEVGDFGPNEGPNIPSTHRVQILQSPYINTFHQHHAIKVTIDSGAETNMIKESVAAYIGACVTKSSQSALQADGQSPLVVKGETRIVLTRDNHTFQFEGLVVENMDVDILAGVPFMSMNDIAVCPTKKQVILGDDTIYIQLWL